MGVVKPVGKQEPRVLSVLFYSAQNTHSLRGRDGVLAEPFRLEKTLKVRSNCNGTDSFSFLLFVSLGYLPML